MLQLGLTLVCASAVGQVKPKPAADLAPDKIYAKISPSLVLISAETSTGSKLTATGFFINKTGIAVTTYNLVKDAKKATAKLSTGEVYDISGVVDSDPTKNIAIIKVKVAATKAVPTNMTDPAIGSTAYLLGSSDGLAQGINPGIISSTSVANNFMRYQYSCPTTGYSSGSALVNPKGEVIGVTALYQSDPKHPDVAIPIKYVLGLDASLPTKPFPLTPAATTQQSTPKVDLSVQTKPRALPDNDLVSAILDMNDGISTIELIRLESQVPNSFKNWTTDDADDMGMSLSMDFEDLADAASDDPMKEASRKELMKVIDKVMVALDDVIKGFDQAKKDGGWTKAAGDALNEGLDVNNKLPFDGSTDKLVKDPAFQKLMPNVYLEASGLKPDDAGFPLGVRLFVQDSLQFLGVTHNSLGAKLGFHDMDRFIYFNGVKPKDIDDLKQMIKKNVGQTVTFKVKPMFEAEKDYQVTIPMNLNQP